MSLLLGPASFFVLVVCMHYGYCEYFRSKHWYNKKRKKLLQGVAREKLNSDHQFFLSFFKYMYLPLFLYCLLIYGLYHLGEQSEVVRNALWSYFEANKNFYWYSEGLYKTIGRHYAVVVTNNIFRAEMLVHIYAVVFNGMLLTVLFLIPSIKTWFHYSYQFMIRQYNKRFCLFACAFLLVMVIIIFWLYFYIIDAPHKHDSRRWSYHIFLDDKFLFNLIMISAVVPLGLFGMINGFFAYAYALIYGSKKTIKTVENKNE
jgi:hypothetical protein